MVSEHQSAGAGQSGVQGLLRESGSFPLRGWHPTFAQGFLAGQLSVVIIALLAIRYIIFEDSRVVKGRPRKPSSLPLRTGTGRKSVSAGAGSSHKDGALIGSSGDFDVGRVMADVLDKVQYELDSHIGESLDWFNVLVAQALAGYRQDIMAGGWSATEDDPLSRDRPGATDKTPAQRTAKDWMEEILNHRTVGRGMTFLDPIQVTQVDFGDSYPIFSNAKVRPADDMGRIRVEADVDYTDNITLAVETKVLINIPKPRFAVLPISLGLTIERFSGTVAMELFSKPGTPTIPIPGKILPRSRHELHFSLHPDFELDATAASLVGSRAKLQDLPKIEQLLVGRVRSYIHDRFVWPRFWTLTLPNLVPRHATNEPSESEGDANSRPTQGDFGLSHGFSQDDLQRVPNGKGGLRTEGDQHEGGIFFEQAPPLFPGGLFQQHPDHSPPGGLPTVEAWRSRAAASAPAQARHAPSESTTFSRDSRHASYRGGNRDLPQGQLPSAGAPSAVSASINGLHTRQPDVRRRPAAGAY